MRKRISRYFALTTAICAILLTGCNRTPSSSDLAENSAPPSRSSATASVTEEATTTTSFTTMKNTTTTTAGSQSKNTTSSIKTSSTTSVATTSTKASTISTKTSTTTATTTTTTTTNPNRVTVNGKDYAIGDTFQYTVMVKTAENYGRVTVAVRYVQKGLEIPNGLPIKQQQAVMNNLGVGMLIGPEESAKQNGFTVTSNKGFSLDSTVAGYAGLVRFFETTNYHSDTQSYRPIDCSNGVALYTVTLKITKPGEYLVDCLEYPSKNRTDLTVWGEISA